MANTNSNSNNDAPVEQLVDDEYTKEEVEQIASRFRQAAWELNEAFSNYRGFRCRVSHEYTDAQLQKFLFSMHDTVVLLQKFTDEEF